MLYFEDALRGDLSRHQEVDDDFFLVLVQNFESHSANRVCQTGRSGSWTKTKVLFFRRLQRLFGGKHFVRRFKSDDNSHALRTFVVSEIVEQNSMSGDFIGRFLGKLATGKKFSKSR